MKYLDQSVQRYILTYLVECKLCGSYDINTKFNKCQICCKSYCLKCKNQLIYGADRDQQIRLYCMGCYYS